MWTQIVRGLKWFFFSYLWVILILFVLDLVTKRCIEAALWHGDYQTGYSDCVTVIPNFFYIRVLHNKGAAWGSFSGNTLLLGIISSIAGAAMIALLVWKWKKLNWWYKSAMYLLIPGCFGNLIDRLFYPQGVIDFLEFHFGSYVFPSFNVADMCLVIGCFLLIGVVLTEDYIKPLIAKKKGQDVEAMEKKEDESEDEKY